MPDIFDQLDAPAAAGSGSGDIFDQLDRPPVSVGPAALPDQKFARVPQPQMKTALTPAEFWNRGMAFADQGARNLASHIEGLANAGNLTGEGAIIQPDNPELGQEARLKGAKQAATSGPILPLSQFAPNPGLAHGVLAAGEGLTTPANLELMGATIATGGTAPLAGWPLAGIRALNFALGGYFTYQFGKGATEKIAAARDDWKKQDYPAVADDLGYASVDALMAAFGIYHGAKSGNELLDTYVPIGPGLRELRTDQWSAGHSGWLDPNRPVNADEVLRPAVEPSRQNRIAEPPTYDQQPDGTFAPRQTSADLVPVRHGRPYEYAQPGALSLPPAPEPQASPEVPGLSGNGLSEGGKGDIFDQIEAQSDGRKNELNELTSAPETTSGPAGSSKRDIFDQLEKKADAATSGERQSQDSGETPKYDFSSTQANLTGPVAEAIKAHAADIPEDKLAADGREEQPHVTVKYGLHTEDPAEVAKLLEGEAPIALTLGKTSLFKNEEADVLKADADSPDLHRLNAKIAAALPNTETHPEYLPHATIAYLKPGEGEAYSGKAVPGVTGQRVIVDRIAFSGKDGQQVEIPLTGKSPKPRDTRDTEPQELASDHERAGETGRDGRVSGAGEAGERQPLATGKQTTVLIPGEDVEIPARYEVWRLRDLITSHNGLTFSANPEFTGDDESQNERDYSKPVNQQRILQQSSEEKFRERWLITDNPDAVNGPPVAIRQTRKTIGGNSRGMTLQIVYGRNGEAANRYVATLDGEAGHYGLAANWSREDEPVLVRVVDAADLAALPGGSKWAIRKTNVSGTAALTGAEQAAADAGQITPQVKADISATIDAAGEDATLNEALSGPRGTALVNKLIAQGFFNEQNRPALMDEKTGAITSLAKDRIAKALLGEFFRNADQIDRFPASLKQKLEKIAAPLATIASDPAWDLLPAIREATDLIEYAEAHDLKNLDDVAAQAGMFEEKPEPQWSPEAVTLATLLRDAKPNAVVAAFRKYVNSKDATPMFGDASPQESFLDAFTPNGGGSFFASLRSAPRLTGNRDENYTENASTLYHATRARYEPIALEGEEGNYAQALVTNLSGIEYLARNAGYPHDYGAAHMDGFLVQPLPGFLGQLIHNLRLDLRNFKGAAPMVAHVLAEAERAYSAGKSLILVSDHEHAPAAPSTLEEELDHALQFAETGNLLDHLKTSASVFVQSSEGKIAKAHLEQRYQFASDGHAAAEIGARLLRGDDRDLGLLEPQGLTLSTLYVQFLKQEYGNAARKTIEKVENARGQERRDASLQTPGRGEILRPRNGESGFGQTALRSNPRNFSDDPEDQNSVFGPNPQQDLARGDASYLQSGNRNDDALHRGRPGDSGRSDRSPAEIGNTRRRPGNADLFDNSEPSLFDDGTGRELAQDAARDRDQLQGERLTAQFKSPLTREEQLKKLKRKQLEKQNDLFGSNEEPPQGALFDKGDDDPARSVAGQRRNSQSEETGGVTLGSGLGALDPYVRKLLQSDITPSLKQTAELFKLAKKEVPAILAPASVEGAQGTALNVRHQAAALARSTDQVHAALAVAKKYFDRQDAFDNMAFVDRMECGEPQPGPELQTIADTFRAILDSRREAIQALGTGKLQKFITDYFPHIWKKPDQAKQFLANVTKRPLEGSKSFLKKRSIATFKEGIDAGLEPISDNPAELVLLKAREMDKYLTAHRILKTEKEAGRLQFVDAREGQVPLGWQKIDDPVATVYGPSVQPITEYPNEGLWNGLEKVGQALGLSHSRGFLNLRGAVGRAYKGKNQIDTLHGSAEDVVAHEIGHQIDWLAGSGKQFVLEYPDKQTVERIRQARQILKDTAGTSKEQRKQARLDLADLHSAIQDRKQFAAELRALADLRSGRKEYTHKREEKMAQLAEMWVGSRELFQRTAPHVFARWQRFLDDNPKLHALRDIEGNTEVKPIAQPYDVGGLVIKGHWYAPEPSARILNNYLSPGLRDKSAIVRSYFSLSNLLNQAQLGFSGFHAMFTGLESISSKLALAIYQMGHGDIGKGLGSAAFSPLAPVTTYRRGSQLLKEWLQPGTQGQFIGSLVDAMVQAGGRAHMESFYRTHIAAKMVEAWRKGNLFGAVARAPFAAFELPTKLIMEELVPRLKAGAFADLAQYELSRLPEGATIADCDAALAKAWDSIDNRFGQLVYDNLFWHKYVKDLAMMLVRSPGWNLGSVREIGGGYVDTAKFAAKAVQGKAHVGLSARQAAAQRAIAPPETEDEQRALPPPPPPLPDDFTHRMAYLPAHIILSATIGAILYYIWKGEAPHKLKDYFFPRDAHDKRWSPATYFKDEWQWGHDPIRTAEGKVNPLLKFAENTLANKDGKGRRIVNPHHHAWTQVKEATNFLLKQFEPIWLQQLQEPNSTQTLDEKVLPEFGITRAPKSVSHPTQ